MLSTSPPIAHLDLDDAKTLTNGSLTAYSSTNLTQKYKLEGWLRSPTTLPEFLKKLQVRDLGRQAAHGRAFWRMAHYLFG